MRKFILLLVFTGLVVLTANFLQGAQESRIAGVITNANGRPAASVWVMLYDRNEKQVGRSLTGDDGRYYIGYLKPGTYTLKVKKRDNVLEQRSVRIPGDESTNIRLP